MPIFYLQHNKQIKKYSVNLKQPKSHALAINQIIQVNEKITSIFEQVHQNADVRLYFIEGLFCIVLYDDTCEFPMTLFSSAIIGIYLHI